MYLEGTSLGDCRAISAFRGAASTIAAVDRVSRQSEVAREYIVVCSAACRFIRLCRPSLAGVWLTSRQDIYLYLLCPLWLAICGPSFALFDWFIPAAAALEWSFWLDPTARALSLRKKTALCPPPRLCCCCRPPRPASPSSTTPTTPVPPGRRYSAYLGVCVLTYFPDLLQCRYLHCQDVIKAFLDEGSLFYVHTLATAALSFPLPCLSLPTYLRLFR